MLSTNIKVRQSTDRGGGGGGLSSFYCTVAEEEESKLGKSQSE